MRAIISPAKKMRCDADGIEPTALPVFLNDTEKILAYLRSFDRAGLRKLWACNEQIAEENDLRVRSMDLRRALSPAILAYDGIQYQYMAPAVFEDRMLSYVQEHVRILSGFYGVLRPLDGVTPYRLEMQAKARIGGCRDLYEYWGRRLYDEVRPDDGIFIGLASKEYSICVERYLQPNDRFINCIFAERDGEKLIQKGVYVKMARGEMVRFMAEGNIRRPEDLKAFDRLGHRFEPDLSDDKTYVFLRRTDKQRSFTE